MVWQRVPKEVYIGREILEMGLCDAVAHFNEALGIPAGKYTEAGCHQQDQSCVHLTQRKSLDATKRRRKVLRGLRKRKDDKGKEGRGCELCLWTVLDISCAMFYCILLQNEKINFKSFFLKS